MTQKLPPASYIDSDEALAALVQSLQDETLMAVDTESNNMYAYQGRVCLVQISTRTADYIIDPFPIEDMQPLGDLLADERMEKIFHAAEYDLICLQRDYGFEVRNLFDTMFAARLCHVEQFGLGDLLTNYFNVEVDKSHQLDNWGKRPLDAESLRYAQMDTHYLPALRDKLYEQLKTLKRLDEAQEVFADVLRIDSKGRVFDEYGYWKIGLPHSLTRRQMALLKELYLEREKIAEQQDVPPFKIVSNKALVAIARKKPRNHQEMFQIRALSPAQVRLHGNHLLKAIERGQKIKPPKKPNQDTPDPVVADRYMVLHAWRKERAIERGLDSSLVLSKQTLWELARQHPTDKESLTQIEGIGDWRLQAYGEELLEVLQNLP